MRLLILLLLLLNTLFASAIKEYRPVSGCTLFNSVEYKLLRQFHYNNHSYYLALNPNTIETSILDTTFATPIKCSKEYYNSRYYYLLQKSSMPPFPLQNDGITHASSGVFLTIDLCPSLHKGYEKRLFNALIMQTNRPVWVTLFVTKRWIFKHFKAFMQLKNWQKMGLIKITWGNHTAYHHFYKNSALEHNFVLAKQENLVQDILDLEVTLLNYGVLPSPFFRFPGLVSDKKSVDIVKSLGLIVIGSDSWLAKGQIPKDGSIILIHGNKNEPKGVDIFLEMLQKGKIKEFNALWDL